jgi:hypothetical protein
MEKTINKFLDEYLGDEVVVRKRTTGKYPEYFIVSKKSKETIIWFIYNTKSDNYTLFRGGNLVNWVSGIFSITDHESSTLIKHWFGNKHNLSKVGDLKKFRLIGDDGFFTHKKSL